MNFLDECFSPIFKNQIWTRLAISSDVLSGLFSLLSFWDSCYVYVDILNGVPQISKDLFLFLRQVLI